MLSIWVLTKVAEKTRGSGDFDGGAQAVDEAFLIDLGAAEKQEQRDGFPAIAGCAPPKLAWTRTFSVATPPPLLGAHESEGGGIVAAENPDGRPALVGRGYFVNDTTASTRKAGQRREVKLLNLSVTRSNLACMAVSAHDSHERGVTENILGNALGGSENGRAGPRGWKRRWRLTVRRWRNRRASGRRSTGR